ncbi:hypothetical protein SAMN05421812_13632 [Asanoa hainanensis]|uniref:N-acetyltransferase domain-containing protein n=2 Tax=Asanoa TaxID=195964 RepID=A0A239PHL3_9ACTN|nr:hypothetical protein [Asanoa hainanensis]SNT66285.1 hypothetical protein SAMN05421812_13632 [Asanoa hainanensis]
MAATRAEIVVIRPGDNRYERVMSTLRADRPLLRRMWREAESRLDEHRRKTWVVAVGAGDRALAWCAYEPFARGCVKAVNSFERPEVWGQGLYERVYNVRHQLIRYRRALTFIFDQPLPLHLRDGWVPVADGWSSEPDAPSHHWNELRRPADQSHRGVGDAALVLA